MLSSFFFFFFLFFLGLDIQGVSTFPKKTSHVHTEYMWPFMLGKEWMWQKWWTSHTLHNRTLVKVYSSNITILLQTVSSLLMWVYLIRISLMALRFLYLVPWSISLLHFYHRHKFFSKSIAIADKFLKWSSCTTIKSYK